MRTFRVRSRFRWAVRAFACWLRGAVKAPGNAVGSLAQRRILNGDVCSNLLVLKIIEAFLRKLTLSSDP
jgi:hypothetical protein